MFFATSLWGAQGTGGAGGGSSGANGPYMWTGMYSSYVGENGPAGYFGGRGAKTNGPNSNGSNATGYGNGGSGPNAQSSSGNWQYGSGTAGIVVVEW